MEFSRATREVNWRIDAVRLARDGEILVVVEFIWLLELVRLGPLGMVTALLNVLM